MRRLSCLLAAILVSTFATVSQADEPPTDPPATEPAPSPAAPTTAAPTPAPAPMPAYSGPPPPGYPAPAYPPPWAYGPPPGAWGGYPPPGDEPGTTRRSTGMMVTGIVFTAIGAANVIGGAALLAAAPKTCVDFDEGGFGGVGGDDGCDPNPTFVLASGLMMGIGGTLAVVGIPLWVVGAGKPKPAQESTVSLAPSRPTVLVGPRAAAVRWSF